MTRKTRLNKRRNLIGRVSAADINLFRVFQTVVDCGGLSAAQSELGVGRSTISRQISHLETRFGFTLCYRGRSGFKLTQHGEQALAYIAQFLDAADEFTTNISAINDNFTGEIYVAMVDSSFTDPNNPMLGAIRAFRDRAPQVKINLSVESPGTIERGILDGTYHLGIVPSYRQLTELSYHELYQEKVSLYVGPTHPLLSEIEGRTDVSIDDVTQHELVYRGYLEGEKLKDLKQQFARGPTVLQTEAVTALVQAGAYLGFLPKSSASASLTSILPDRFEYSAPISVVIKRSREHSVLTRAFLEDLLRK